MEALFQQHDALQAAYVVVCQLINELEAVPKKYLHPHQARRLAQLIIRRESLLREVFNLFADPKNKV